MPRAGKRLPLPQITFNLLMTGHHHNDQDTIILEQQGRYLNAACPEPVEPSNSQIFRTANRAELPVICIGNLTVGGTEKPRSWRTSMIGVAAGHAPAILSRGYGGSATKLSGLIRKYEASMCGDEPLMLPKDAKCAVRPCGWCHRHFGARPATTHLMDDGLQNPFSERSEDWCFR